MQLSVIIVNYNVKYFLEQCLFSVQKALVGIDAEVIVVDNASTDGSRDYLEPLFPGVRFIWNTDNPGFGRACNQGIGYSSGSNVLFLNPDTIVPEDCFHICLQFLQEHMDAGALGIRMLDGQGKFLPESKRSFPSPLTAFYKLSGLASLFPYSKNFGQYHLGHLNEHKDHEVDVLAGAFMMVRRDVLDRIGGFDPAFFMYGEDIDLSYRIQQLTIPNTEKNYKNYYVSRSSILHFKGESTRKGSLNYVRLFYLAMSQFVQKHTTVSGSGLFSFMINAAIWVRAAISLLRQFVRKAALPVLDALIIYGIFWFSKKIWIQYFRPEIVYSKSLLQISFTGFSVLFLIVSYYTGLYQKKFRFSQLFYSSATSLLIILSAYSLLPETIRFSRGIVLMGSILSFIVLLLWRQLLLLIDFIEREEDEARLYTLVVGTENDKYDVARLVEQTNTSPLIRGWISTSSEDHALGSTSQIPTILKSIPATQLILCEGDRFSFKEIISFYETNAGKLQLRLHSAGSKSIVGSDSKEYSGEAIGEPRFLLLLPVNRRLKRMLDVVLALLFLLVFPVHFLFNPHPLRLLLHCFQVLFFKKTWIGFTGNTLGLPKLRPSVLGPAGLPHSMNRLSPEALREANKWYAQEYAVMYDLITVFSHYKKLGVN
jgi:GT2 family glycosyltransferase